IRNIKTEAFNEFIKSDSGLAHIYQIRKLMLAMRAHHLGVLIDSNLPQVEPHAVDDTSLTVIPGEAPYEVVRKVANWWEKPIERRGRRIDQNKKLFPNPKTKGAALLWGLGTGILSAGILPTSYRIYRSFKPGQEIVIKKSSDAL